MRRYQRSSLEIFLALGLIALCFTGCATMKTVPKAQLQVIPENTIVSPALMKEPIKFKGSGFAPKEMVVVDILLPKGMKIIGLGEGENSVGIALTTSDELGNFDASMEPMATMQTLLQVPWVETETGAKPDFKQARGFPPGVYTILAIGMDSELRAMSTLTILPPPMKK
jgi:hypothetical protein